MTAEMLKAGGEAVILLLEQSFRAIGILMSALVQGFDCPCLERKG